MAWYLRRFALLVALAVGFIAAYDVAAWVTAGRHVDLMTRWDRAIPLVPWTAWLYVPLYALGIVVTGFLIRDGRLLRTGIVAACVGQAINTLGYLALPSAYPRDEAFAAAPAQASGMTLLRLVHTIDPPHNTFPSAHVMIACLCAALAWRTGSRWRWLPALTGLGVAISVATTKQHYLVDSVAGVLVGAASLAAADRLVGPGRPPDA